MSEDAHGPSLSEVLGFGKTPKQLEDEQIAAGRRLLTADREYPALRKLEAEVRRTVALYGQGNCTVFSEVLNALVALDAVRKEARHA